MGSYSRYRPGTKRKRKGDGQDFRWKKAKQERKREQGAFFEDREMTSGDALDDFAPADSLPTNDASQTPKKAKKETPRSIKVRQLEAKRRRREHHEQEREEADALVRHAPHRYLWSRYRDWAGDKLSTAELAQEWESEDVTVLEDSGGSLIPHLKALLGDDYVTRGGYNGGTPGVAVIALAASALNAVGFAKRLYDGFAVGKLFSKHVKIQEQKEWLVRSCRKGLPPTAAGTAKRIERLIEEGDMTLDHTVGLVIDMSRDLRLLNIVDMHATREELFQLLHRHVSPLIAKGKMKIILCIPKVQATKLEDVKDELTTRMQNAKKRRKSTNQETNSEEQEE